MLDLLIQGGTVVSPEATEQIDVGVSGGRIVVLAARHSLDLKAARVLDARGKLVVPGGIDAHCYGTCHCVIALWLPQPSLRRHRDSD